VVGLGRGSGPKGGGGGGGSVGGMTLSAHLATAYLDGGEVYRQTDTGNLELIRFYAPLDVGSVVLTLSSPSGGRSCFGEGRFFLKPK
jgi:hypothetical protein